MKEILIKNKSGVDQLLAITEQSDGITLVKYKSYEVTDAYIPEAICSKPVTEIADYCFIFCAIEHVFIPPTVKRIGVEAFAMCQRLQEIMVPNSVTELGVAAFRDCKSLRKIVLSDSLEKLPTGLFSFCRMYNPDIHLPKYLKEIGDCCFWSGGAGKLVLPDSVEKIGNGAFYSSFDYETSLPFDKRWISAWPYGEEVVSAEHGKGMIDGEKAVQDGCTIFSVLFSTGIKKEYFFPCEFGTVIEFSNDKTQKRLEEQVTANSEDVDKLYSHWSRGLL